MNGFDLSTIIDAKLGTTQLSSIYLGSNKLWPLAIDYSKEYLTIESLEDNNTIYFTNVGMDARTISWSTDKSSWTNITTAQGVSSTITTLNTGDVVYIKGTTNYYGQRYNYYHKFESTGQFNVYGNIMSMLYGDNFIGQTTLPSVSSQYQTISSIFTSSKVVDASNLILPATTLAFNCYFNMFAGCTLLTAAPELPATTLVSSCYNGMFQGCTSLTAAPELPATTLADSCYNYMFYGCTSLTTAPELPATTLEQYCYSYMFFGCTSLTTAPELPATTLASNCYSNMFAYASITAAPVLPATTLVSNCYRQMFYNASSLTYIKAMFTTTPSTSYTRMWVSGVSATGTYVKNIDASYTDTGIHAIPEGWTVQTASS